MAITENLDTYLADFGVTVVCGAVSGSGILDMPDQIVGGGIAISADLSVTVKASLFSSVALFGAAITVNGVGYTVREAMALDDGAFLRITLSQ